MRQRIAEHVPSLQALCLLVPLSCARGAPLQTLDEARGATPSAPAVTPEELTSAPGHLELAELALNQNGRPELVLHADGNVEAPIGHRIGKLERNGRFLDANGTVIATFTEAGEILDSKGNYLPVTIEPSGTVKLLKENRVMELRADGTLLGANPEGPVVTISGVTPATRRTAMFLLVLSAYPVRPGL